MNRAYSILNIKSVADDGEFFKFSGIASTPTVDRQGDIVEPMGAQFKLPMPLIWQHMSDKPVGQVTFAKPTKDGIPFEAQIPYIREAGVLKDRIDEAIQSIKYKLVAAVSIGFVPIADEIERMKDGGLRFLKWLWLELSLVTIPANAEATITTIKSIDKAQLAASGQGSRVVTLSPGVSGQKQIPQTPKGKTVKTIQEQIASFEAKRAASQARMDEIMAKSAEEGRTLDDAETQEYDGLKAEVKSVDDHLVRLRAHEATVVSKAAQVTAAAGSNEEDASRQRQGVVVTGMKSNLPKGTAFTRYAMALARSKGNLMMAEQIAKQWHDTTPEVEVMIKAAVSTGTTTDSTWAAPLALPNTVAAEFVELLRPKTILGKLQGVRRVPFNIRFPRATAGTTSGWVGQGSPKPVSRMSFETMTMNFTKIATIVAMTDELVRFSNPSAEEVVRNDMIAAIAQYSDQQFIDPTVTASAGVRPASITNGLTQYPSTGAGTPSIANVKTDIATLFNVMVNANIAPTSPVWIMHPRTALFLSLLATTQDIPAFPTISLSGGTLMGIPVITSANVPIESGNSTIIVLLDAAEIFLADDGGVTLDVSMEASLQMDGAPSAGAQSLVSLWQNNMVGVRAERYINWQRRREAAVAILDSVLY